MIAQRAQTLMLVGTCSNAGKSVLAAAFCRIFARDGLRVTPFKSQNMSNNAFIAPDGREMGRAQAMQAECAGVVPDARMNPILLKPAGNGSSQLVFNGRAGEMYDVRQYHQMRNRLAAEVAVIFEELAAGCDLVVLEGAGSPAEINIKKRDIANMGMAKIANAPTILVGDIDKGGVFASLYGTVMLLDPDERAMIKGFIINKFRGDPTLLTPGLEQLEAMTGIPVLGVIPYFHLTLDDEDSAGGTPVFSGHDAAGLDANQRSALAIDVAVIHIPHVSNATDLNALALEPGVSVRFVEPGAPLGKPDLIVVPNSQNPIAAAQVMRDAGCLDAIRVAADGGAYVVGICGGYQVLGTRIDGPQRHGTERKSCEGIGLLNVATICAEQVTAVAVNGVESAFSTAIQGHVIQSFEQTRQPSTTPFLNSAVPGDAVVDGTVSHDGHIIGSCCYGLFDNGAFTRALVNAIRRDRGRPPYDGPLIDYAAFKESQYDALADIVAQNVDLEAVRNIIARGV